jgi:hypothetical protein
MAGVGSSMGAHGELAGEGKEGEEGEGGTARVQLGAPRGGGGLQEGAVPWDSAQPLLCSVLLPACCAVREEEEKEEREKKKKRKEKKRKKYGKFSKHENFLVEK